MRTIGTALLCLTLSGCITTHATLVDPTATRYPRVTPDSVRIFTDRSELDTLDFVRVAIIEASGSGEWTNQSEMLEAMRKKAGELGGNGVRNVARRKLSSLEACQAASHSGSSRLDIAAQLHLERQVHGCGDTLERSKRNVAVAQ